MLQGHDLLPSRSGSVRHGVRSGSGLSDRRGDLRAEGDLLRGDDSLLPTEDFVLLGSVELLWRGSGRRHGERSPGSAEGRSRSGSEEGLVA